MSYWPLRDVTGSHGVAVQAPPAVGSLLLLVGLVLQLLPAGSLLLQLLLWTTEGNRQLSLGGTPGSEREPAVKPTGMYLHRLAARVREVLLRVKVQRVDGQQPLILPHLEETKAVRRS